MTIDFNTVEFDQSELASLHDIILDALDMSLSVDEVRTYWFKLPDEIKLDSIKYGISDTVIRENIHEWLEENCRPVIDLRTCEPGDLLISSLGSTLEYVRPTVEGEYLDHVVKYLEKGLGHGTRTHDGFVYLNKRKPETDHDIVKIIRK